MPLMEYPLIQLLYDAMNSPLGIVVQTEDPERLRQKLYAERKKDSDLSALSITLSRTSPESEIWIVRKDVES